jgi:predicted ferric reductase
MRPSYAAVAFRTKTIKENTPMLWTIFVILLVLWLLGMVTSYTLYGYIHLLLVIAVAVLLIRLIQGRRAL